MRYTVVAAIAVVSVAGCGTSHSSAQTWPGKFFSTNHRIDFWDQTYDMTDAKILCSQADGGLKILITGPDGTRVTSTRPQDGSQKADIEVTGGHRGAQTLAGGAVWKNVNGEWGFEGNPDDADSHKVFYPAPQSAPRITEPEPCGSEFVGCVAGKLASP